MKVPGREEPIFADDIFPEIYRLSGGIPRRINHICDACLMTGFARKKEKIDSELFEESGKIFGGLGTPEGSK